MCVYMYTDLTVYITLMLWLILVFSGFSTSFQTLFKIRYKF